MNLAIIDRHDRNDKILSIFPATRAAQAWSTKLC